MTEYYVPASRGESIEMACEIHGIDADELVEVINKYLESQETAENE